MTRAGRGIGLPVQRRRPSATVDVALRPFVAEDAEALADYHRRNRAFFRLSQPARAEAFFTAQGQRDVLRAEQAAVARGEAFVLGLFRGDGHLVGHATLSAIVRGSFLNAYLGYAIDRDHTNRGYATHAVAEVVEHAFASGLHRVQAAVLPDNEPSRRVVTKVGFRREGLARRYLQLDGAWRDHELYAITVEDARGL